MIRNVIVRLCSSHSAKKCVVALDPEIQQNMNNCLYKPRKHPGINETKIVSLPEDLTKVLKIVLHDTSSKSFQEDSEGLDNYLRSRLPPPEQIDIDQKATKILKSLENQKKNRNLNIRNDVEAIEAIQKRNVKLFNILKGKVYRWANILYNESTSLQYLMVRSAPEYAVLIRLFGEINKRWPDYKPRSFFDFGSGVGTGTWAVNKYWKNHLFEYFCVDTSSDMHELARLVLCKGRENVELPFRGYFQRQFLPASSKLKYNIVLSAYSLFELPDMKTRLETIQKLWNKTEDFLVIVEQGSNAGFKLVNEARDYVLEISKSENSGYVVAPCPSDKICPRFMEQKTPCNFLIKYFSLAFPGKSQLKVELFSYVILRKGQRPSNDPQWPRIVRAPIVRSGHTICRMCTSKGELKEVIFTKAKHDKNTYRCARSSCWGDLLPVKIDDPIDHDLSEKGSIKE